MRARFLILFSVISLSVAAQTATKNSTKFPGRTSFFAEVGGPGILFSANIDTRFKPSHLGLGGRIGLGFVTADEMIGDPNNYNYKQRSVVTIPAQLNYIFGKPESPHTFEVGAGLTYVGKELEIMNFYDEDRTQLFGTTSFMYRRQPVNGGFTWRIGFTPLIGSGYIQPFGAVGVGFNF